MPLTLLLTLLLGPPPALPVAESTAAEPIVAEPIAAEPRAVAQEPPAAPPSAIERFREELADYDMTAGGKPLSFRPEPILHWTNPARYGEDGALFVWTAGGRPEVIGTGFTFRVGNSVGHAHEFHTLSQQPITAVKEGTTAWAPRQPGLTFAALKSAGKPAGTEAGRLIQMRAIARSFDIDFHNDEGTPTRLRLVSTPLFRYAAPESGVPDGAIFSFANATDPEALLVVEARGSGAAAHWEYALARFHFQTLQATRDGATVWEVPREPGLLSTRFGDGQFVDAPYTIFRFPYTQYTPPTP